MPRLAVLLLLLIALLVAGCGGDAQPTQTPVVIVVTATPIPASATPETPPTSTPVPLPTNTPVPANTPTPELLPSPVSMQDIMDHFVSDTYTQWKAYSSALVGTHIKNWRGSVQDVMNVMSEDQMFVVMNDSYGSLIMVKVSSSDASKYNRGDLIRFDGRIYNFLTETPQIDQAVITLEQ